MGCLFWIINIGLVVLTGGAWIIVLLIGWVFAKMFKG